MPNSSSTVYPSSLLGVTIRRSFSLGRLFLITSLVESTVFSTLFAFAGASTFGRIVPVLLPIFAVVAALGGMMLFTNDRLKGVLEYLLAYGISPRRLFRDVLVASMVLASVLLVVASAIGLAAFALLGNDVSATLLATLGLYTLPMSFGSAAFAVTIGMYWTSMSSPRTGMNSPVGLLPIVGITPPLATLIAVEALPVSAVYVLIGAVGLLAAAVLALVLRANSLLRPERLLSPA